jgi:hypothetical protein
MTCVPLASGAQVEYLVDLSIHFRHRAVHVKDWAAMDDEAIIAELIAILLALDAGRRRCSDPDDLTVLPLDDVGLINGISQNYFSGESVQPVTRTRGRRSLELRIAAWRLGMLALGPSDTGRMEACLLVISQARHHLKNL